MILFKERFGYVPAGRRQTAAGAGSLAQPRRTWEGKFRLTEPIFRGWSSGTRTDLNLNGITIL